MSKEEFEKSPYCEICGHCGYIGCCGISNFIDNHIKGKTNCENEEIIISELEDICTYQTEVFKDNDKLQSQLDIANKKLEEIEGYVKLRRDELNDFKNSTINSLFDVDVEKFMKDILSIIGGE